MIEAIRADTSLTGRQRQALVEIYEAFAAQQRQAGAQAPPPSRAE